MRRSRAGRAGALILRSKRLTSTVHCARGAGIRVASRAEGTVEEDEQPAETAAAAAAALRGFTRRGSAGGRPQWGFRARVGGVGLGAGGTRMRGLGTDLQ